MREIKCSVCGAPLLNNGDNLVCSNCGSKYNKEDFINSLYYKEFGEKLKKQNKEHKNVLLFSSFIISILAAIALCIIFALSLFSNQAIIMNYVGISTSIFIFSIFMLIRVFSKKEMKTITKLARISALACDMFVCYFLMSIIVALIYDKTLIGLIVVIVLLCLFIFQYILVDKYFSVKYPVNNTVKQGNKSKKTINIILVVTSFAVLSVYFVRAAINSLVGMRIISSSSSPNILNEYFLYFIIYLIILAVSLTIIIISIIGTIKNNEHYSSLYLSANVFSLLVMSLSFVESASFAGDRIEYINYNIPAIILFGSLLLLTTTYFIYNAIQGEKTPGNDERLFN